MRGDRSAIFARESRRAALYAKPRRRSIALMRRLTGASAVPAKITAALSSRAAAMRCHPELIAVPAFSNGGARDLLFSLLLDLGAKTEGR
jgi:hypothetical protein